jgi:hypothetical protein
VDAILRDMFLWVEEGYWTPFTMATLTSPRRIVGMLLLIDLRRLGQSCRLDVVELGGARKGLALIRPSEKMNDPTPTSICRKGFSGWALNRSQEQSKSGLKEKTHQRGPPEFRLAKLAREDGKVDGEDREDGDDHHVRSVDGQVRLSGSSRFRLGTAGEGER